MTLNELIQILETTRKVAPETGNQPVFVFTDGDGLDIQHVSNEDDVGVLIFAKTND